MEMAILPILALLGLVFLVDFGGDGDGDEGGEEKPEPEGDLNYMPFGPEDDVATGTDEADAMYLNEGDDLATGGEGDDRIFLGNGQDSTVVLTEDGDFTTEGMDGDDFIRGGEGRDIIVDSLGSNTLYGDTGYDRMNSVDAEGDEGTADTMFGGFGNDVLFADNGDLLSGGAGDDRFQITATDDMNPVTITDYAEGDQIFLRDEEGGFQVIERITTEASENSQDTNVLLDGRVVLVLQGVTEVPEGAIGNPSAPPLYGTEGDDTLEIGEIGSSVVAYGGDDTIGFADGVASAGRGQLINAGAGDDTVTGGLGDDDIRGGLGNDVIVGAGGNDEIDGGYGNDVIDTVDIAFQTGPTVESDITPDLVFGGAGNDEMTFDALDAVTGGDGTDTFMQVHRGGDAGLASINDFDPDLESIVIESDVIGSPLVFTDLADGTGSHIELEGVPIMYLVGVTAAQAQAADITLVPS